MLADPLQLVEEVFETPHDRPPESIIVITVYLDETEHSDATKYTVVAGFRGDKENWKCLVPAWRNSLGKQRKSLHMKTLHWKKRDRVKGLLERLGPIPYQCGLVPVFGAIKFEDYKDLVQGDPLLSKFGGYIMSFLHVLTHLLDTVPATERIKVVCEIQTHYSALAAQMFDIFQKTARMDGDRPELVSIEFTKKCVLFEPADYLAFSLGKTASELGSMKDVLCRPIQADDQDWSKHPAGKWLGKKVARETILMIQSYIPFLKRAIV